MISRRAVVAAALSAPLVGCDVTGRNTAVIRLKLLARVRVDGVECEGAAVNEIRTRRTPYSLSGFQMSYWARSEATIVDVGDRPAMFFLVTNYLSLIVKAFGVAPSVGSADETTISKLKALSGTAKVPYPHSYFPRIAAFRDESDPTSVFEVDPTNVAKSHGPGAELVGVYIVITDEPPTDRIPARLPWLIPGDTRRLVPPPHGQLLKDASFGELTSHISFKPKD